MFLLFINFEKCGCKHLGVRFFGKHMFLFFLGVELMDYMLNLCFAFWGTFRLFSTVAAPLHIHFFPYTFHQHILVNPCWFTILFCSWVNWRGDNPILKCFKMRCALIFFKWSKWVSAYCYEKNIELGVFIISYRFLSLTLWPRIMSESFRLSTVVLG